MNIEIYKKQNNYHCPSDNTPNDLTPSRGGYIYEKPLIHHMRAIGHAWAVGFTQFTRVHRG